MHEATLDEGEDDESAIAEAKLEADRAATALFMEEMELAKALRAAGLLGDRDG
jgi:hypothetical protein